MMAKLYAIEVQHDDGGWTRQGVGGERMLVQRGANGQVFRPLMRDGRPWDGDPRKLGDLDAASEALLRNQIPESLDIMERGQARAVLAAYLGRPTRIVELAVVSADPLRMRQTDPEDPWWAAARAEVAAGRYPNTDGARRDRGIRFLVADPRPTGLEVTVEEADAILTWAAALPGWAHVDRPNGDWVSLDGRVKRGRLAGWTGHQLRREDPA